jgi:predicted nucleic acid-binding protein
LRIAFDTNVLVYAEGVDDEVRRVRALELLERAPRRAVVLPLQVLGELFSVLVRKAKYTKPEARRVVLNWHNAVQTIGTSARAFAAALELAADHGFTIWDAMVLSAAAEGGCDLVLSEDMQDGFTWCGVVIANPFLPERRALLELIPKR